MFGESVFKPNAPSVRMQTKSTESTEGTEKESKRVVVGGGWVRSWICWKGRSLGGFGWAFAHADDVVELLESVGGLVVGAFNKVGDNEEDVAEILGFEGSGRTGGKAIDGGEEGRKDSDVVRITEGMGDSGILDDLKEGAFLVEGKGGMKEAKGARDDLLARLKDAAKVACDGDADLVGDGSEEFSSEAKKFTEGLGFFFGFGEEMNEEVGGELKERAFLGERLEEIECSGDHGIGEEFDEGVFGAFEERPPLSGFVLFVDVLGGVVEKLDQDDGSASVFESCGGAFAFGLEDEVIEGVDRAEPSIARSLFGIAIKGFGHLGEVIPQAACDGVADGATGLSDEEREIRLKEGDGFGCVGFVGYGEFLEDAAPFFEVFEDLRFFGGIEKDGFDAAEIGARLRIDGLSVFGLVLIGVGTPVSVENAKQIEEAFEFVVLGEDFGDGFECAAIFTDQAGSKARKQGITLPCADFVAFFADHRLHFDGEFESCDKGDFFKNKVTIEKEAQLFGVGDLSKSHRGERKTKLIFDETVFDGVSVDVDDLPDAGFSDECAEIEECEVVDAHLKEG